VLCLGISVCQPPQRQGDGHEWDHNDKKQLERWDLNFPITKVIAIGITELDNATAEESLGTCVSWQDRELDCDLGQLTEMKVPGRNSIVSTVMKCMDRVSCSVLAAILCILTVQSSIACAETWLSLAKCWPVRIFLYSKMPLNWSLVNKSEEVKVLEITYHLLVLAKTLQ
jgi:hypothetical protein